MQELINFSVWSSDTERFDNNWQAVADYVTQRGLSGLELLINFDPPPPITNGLVQAVHLPFWVTWLDVWQARPGAVERYFPGVTPEYLPFYCGGATPAEMVAVSARLWQSAAHLGANYAVFHVSHVEPEHAFSRRFTYTDADVIEAAAALLNATAATFPGGEPPVRLFLENLWWPGLTFRDNAVTEQLAARLNFNNWAFVLDTGHLMNTNPELDDEDAAIDFVLENIAGQPAAVRQRIEGVHFSLSTSGAYQRRQRQIGLPKEFWQWDWSQRMEQSRLNAYSIDQHRPFTSPRCRDILAAIEPDFVTHEFLSSSHAEFDAKLQRQLGTLGKPVTARF
jgi:sugar phosphate isomerase/epimerase